MGFKKPCVTIMSSFFFCSPRRGWDASGDLALRLHVLGTINGVISVCLHVHDVIWIFSIWKAICIHQLVSWVYYSGGIVCLCPRGFEWKDFVTTRDFFISLRGASGIIWNVLKTFTCNKQNKSKKYFYVKTYQFCQHTLLWHFCSAPVTKKDSLFGINEIGIQTNLKLYETWCFLPLLNYC